MDTLAECGATVYPIADDEDTSARRDCTPTAECYADCILDQQDPCAFPFPNSPSYAACIAKCE